MTYVRESLGRGSTVPQGTYTTETSGTPKSLRAAGDGRRNLPKTEKLKRKKRKKNKKRRR